MKRTDKMENTFFETLNNSSTLIYGIGNIGRQDDGLGWAFIDWLEKESLCPEAETIRHYQLQLEDADLISGKKRVLFVDATKIPDVQSYQLQSVEAKMDFSFTSHALSVPALMATCEQCFSLLPEVHLLTIKGYAWELQEGLTPLAECNLQRAKAFFLSPLCVETNY